MSEVRRRRRKKEVVKAPEPTKEETAVAKHLRWNCPTKTSTMMGNKVDYFIGSKAVECLLDSIWASGKRKADVLFTRRESAVRYLNRLLKLGFFSRVVRIKKRKGGEKEREKETTKEKEKTDENEGKKPKKKEKKEKSGDLNKEEDAEGMEEPKQKESEGKSAEGKKKRKVKVKLEQHDEQVFLDGDEAYAWIYDPVHPKTFVVGIVVVLATIVICLFPLWPSNIREYVWYVSVAAAACIGLILVLAIFRYVLFGILWAVSGGRHKFWLLPNLTEECGFLESFAPLYTYEYDPKNTTKHEENEEEAEEEAKEDGQGTEQEDEQEHNEKEDENINATKDENSEEKETEGGRDRDSWVKVTDEEVEKAKSEMEEDDKLKLEDDEKTDDNIDTDNVEVSASVTEDSSATSVTEDSSAC